MYKKIKTSVKKAAKKVIDHFRLEPRKVSYIKFLILSLYSAIAYLFFILILTGRMIVDKILIINPAGQLSESSIHILINLTLLLKVIFTLLTLSILMVLYKEYQEFQARKIIKKYQLDVIE